MKAPGFSRRMPVLVPMLVAALPSLARAQGALPPAPPRPNTPPTATFPTEPAPAPAPAPPSAAPAPAPTPPAPATPAPLPSASTPPAPAAPPPAAPSPFEPVLEPVAPQGHADGTLPSAEAESYVSKYPPAVPAPPELFGQEGQLVINGAFSASLGYLGYSPSDASSTGVRLVPTVDLFVVDNLSIGATVLFAYDSTTHVLSGTKLVTDTTELGFGFTLGYNVPIGTTVSFWPRVGMAFGTAKIDTQGIIGTQSVGGTSVPVGGSVDENWVAANLFLPFLFHPVPHFFLGLGPYTYLDLTHEIGNQDDRRFYMGLSSTLGGWF